MEIVTPLSTGAGARGGTKKHVEEWSRLDQLTGVLERARVEADHWSSDTLNSRHHYGKIVDSRARNLADGSVQQQQQTKQLEVFQAHIPGGSVQVIRSHTRTSTSSSWHNSKPILRSKAHSDWPPSLNGSLLSVQHRLNNMEAELDDFKLHDNLVNLNVEKSKANVARLLPSRRPPTRSKLAKALDDDDLFRMPHAQNGVDPIRPLETSPTKKFENESPAADFAALTSPQHAAAAATAASERPSPSSPLRVHEALTKKKSISDENLASVDDENSDSWKRNSKSRWSFQYTRSKFKEPSRGDNGFPEAKSELESVLQRVLQRKGESLPHKTQPEEVRPKTVEPTVFPKRKSFVTEETLKETKQRLRHLNGFNGFGSQTEISSSSSIGGSSGVEPDDGICTDSRGESDKDDDGNANGTNDSASSFINPGISSSAIDTSTYKSDEWYDRRKSYGFEPASNFSLKKTIFSDAKSTPKTNISTDSGICRSSELELASTSMIRKLTAEAKSHQDESRLQKPEIPELPSKSADVFELLRKFEKREAATLAKPTSDSWKTASDLIERSHTSGADLWRRPRTPKDEDSTAPTRIINDSWIRTKASPDPFELDSSTSSKTSIASANSWSTTTSKTRVSDSAEAAPVTRGRVLEALESLRQNSNSSSFEPHSQLFRRSNDSQEMDDLVLKRHSIACDDSKYVMSKFSDSDPGSRFCDKLSSPQMSDQPKTTVVNVNGGEAIPLVGGETTVPAADVKKPKKVEFSKTEVHFAAAEPGKIKIVETDEKPPPANLYRRKRRSVSASPKMLGVGSGYTKFGDHEEHKEVADPHECKSRTGRRSSFNAPNSSHISHTWPGDESSSTATPRRRDDLSRIKDDFSRKDELSRRDDFPRRDDFSKKDDLFGKEDSFEEDNSCGKSDSPKAFGSTTCDNGLAVTISSMRPGPNDARRGSWSIFDGHEPKTTPAGYSTKINFGKEGVTVIADTKSRKQSAENVPPKCRDASQEERHFREKLVVRVGAGAGGCAKAAACKSAPQENRFINGFRDSIRGHRFDDRLKSTSLIIDTMRKGAKEPLEQPSTYIMEMNELQQHRRTRQRSLDRLEEPKTERRARGIYNTVPVAKTAHQRSRLPQTDLLEKALNVFDRLYYASREGASRGSYGASRNSSRGDSSISRNCSSSHGDSSISRNCSSGHGDSSISRNCSSSHGDSSISRNCSSGHGDSSISRNCSSSHGDSSISRNCSSGHGDSSISRNCSSSHGDSSISRNCSSGHGDSSMSRNCSSSRAESGISRENFSSSRVDSNASRGNCGAGRANCGASDGDSNISRNCSSSHGDSNASRGKCGASHGNCGSSRGDSNIGRGNCGSSHGDSSISRNCSSGHGDSSISRGNFNTSHGANASRANCIRGDSKSHSSHELNSCRAFVEPSRHKEQLKKVFQRHMERRASQESTAPSPVLHPLISFRLDGNISDDSLKADEEVKSYMSTAALDEYENELAGSWSRRKYLKLVKAHKTIEEDDEILEKSHFKPLRMEEEKVKTITSSSNVDIKRPKITSVAVNVLRDARPDESMAAAAKKFTTILLNANDSKKASPIVPLITGAHDSNHLPHQPELPRSKPKATEEHIIPLRLADDHHCRRTYSELREDRHHRMRESSTSKTSRARSDYKPVTIIHHGVRLPDKELVDGRRLAHVSSVSPKRELVGTKPRSRKSVPLPKEPKESIYGLGSGGGSLRKKTTTTSSSSVVGRERLFDSGRDSWLNLPKERKSTSCSVLERREPSKCLRTPQKLRSGDLTNSDIDSKHTPSSHHLSSRLPTSSSARKSRPVGHLHMVSSTETDPLDLDPDAAAGITSTTYTDASSEEDTTSRRTGYRKQFSKPLTTISEKSRLVDRQDSNRRAAARSATVTTAVTPSTKPLVTRTTSNSSLESRSNSYEFKYPVLKTEERSKRRAARMLQRATSREALMKSGHVSSSEDITSDNDRVATKLKPSRKAKSTRTPKPEATSQQSARICAPARTKPSRLIQQRTATMEINIFNIKDKPEERKRHTYGSTKDQCLRG